MFLGGISWARCEFNHFYRIRFMGFFNLNQNVGKIILSSICIHVPLISSAKIKKLLNRATKNAVLIAIFL
jgi:hypothetical protein